MAKSKAQIELEQQVGELTADLQRQRADFENYRKRVDNEKLTAMKTGETKAILKLLPVVDTIERAVDNIPADIADNKWVQGVAGLVKQLDKSLKDLKLERIEARPGTPFDPSVHQAIQFDEESTGETEVVAAELQPGYKLDGQPIRHAMVKVTKQ
jgi:molecular chaperone GrpE